MLYGLDTCRTCQHSVALLTLLSCCASDFAVVCQLVLSQLCLPAGVTRLCCVLVSTHGCSKQVQQIYSSSSSKAATCVSGVCGSSTLAGITRLGCVLVSTHSCSKQVSAVAAAAAPLLQVSVVYADPAPFPALLASAVIRSAHTAATWNSRSSSNEDSKDVP
jgi:hypothetical protein